MGFVGLTPQKVESLQKKISRSFRKNFTIIFQEILSFKIAKIYSLFKIFKKILRGLWPNIRVRALAINLLGSGADPTGKRICVIFD